MLTVLQTILNNVSWRAVSLLVGHGRLAFKGSGSWCRRGWSPHSRNAERSIVLAASGYLCSNACLLYLSAEASCILCGRVCAPLRQSSRSWRAGLKGVTWGTRTKLITWPRYIMATLRRAYGWKEERAYSPTWDLMGSCASVVQV